VIPSKFLGFFFTAREIFGKITKNLACGKKTPQKLETKKMRKMFVYGGGLWFFFVFFSEIQLWSDRDFPNLFWKKIEKLLFFLKNAQISRAEKKPPKLGGFFNLVCGKKNPQFGVFFYRTRDFGKKKLKIRIWMSESMRSQWDRLDSAINLLKKLQKSQ